MITPKNRWIFHGLFWGAFMFLFNAILWPLAQHYSITSKRLLIGVVFWTLMGLLFGWLTYKVKWTKKTDDKQA